MMRRPFIIGVTGGMASGKSTLARMMVGRGMAHVDADKMVHHLLQHDCAVMAEISQSFPNVSRETCIDRAALARHIAQHPEALSRLEAIIHPHVRAAEMKAIAFATRNRLRALILDVPLLFETGADALCDVVIVAHAPLGVRRARAFARPDMTQEKWQRLIARQWTDAARHHHADVVIATHLGKVHTRKKIMALLRAHGLV